MKTKFLITSCFIVAVLIQSAQAQSWAELGTGTHALNASNRIDALAVDASGTVYAGGGFLNASGKKYVAKWNGISWSELGGTNALQANGNIYSMITDPSGNVYAAGGFENANVNSYVAKFNGSSWSELGGFDALHPDGPIYSLARDNFGNIYAAGEFTDANGYRYVAKWNGTSWSQLGTGANALNANYSILKIIIDNSGNVIAAGQFTDETGKCIVCRWDGTSWTKLGTGTNAIKANGYIYCLGTDPAGNIYAAGNFKNEGTYNFTYVAKWDGTSWIEVGAGAGTALNGSDKIAALAMDGYDIYVGGWFANNNNSRYVAKWNGTTWTELGGTNALQANNTILSVVTGPSGKLYTSGWFQDANNTYYVAEWNGTTTAVTDPENITTSGLYPNPTSESITYEAKENGKLSIYNAWGESMFSESVSKGNISINMETLTNGVYTLTFQGEAASYTPLKIVKN